MRLLVVEDDRSISEAIQSQLQPKWEVEIADTGKAALFATQTSLYDAIVLDLGLPDLTGLTLTEEFRKNNISTPVLILTGNHELPDKLQAFDLGADDYMTKPFHMDELRARLKALIRRSGGYTRGTKLTSGELEIDATSGKAFHLGKALSLRRKEFQLLEYLMKHAGKVVTRDMLLEHVWVNHPTYSTNTVDVHIKFLRDKVDKPFGTHRIKTVHGLGYKLEL